MHAIAHAYATSSLDAIFAGSMEKMEPFETSPELVVAVSGGVDSMALCLLANDWAWQKRGSIHALIVDHGVRAESTTEAMQVKSWLAKRNIKATILPIKPINASEAAMRDARYEAMIDWCKQHNQLHVLLGHHQDDQIETYIMRSQRGSGPDGLAGMTKLRVKSGVQLLRPLLNVSKYQLIDYLNLHGQSWVEDSSNLDMRYSRNRIRKQLLDNECEQDGIKENINTCAEQRYYMETQTACNIAAYTSIFPEGYGDLAINAWRNLPKAMAKRVLNSLAQTISGRGYPLRSEKLESLYIQMMNLPFSAATCNGCKWMIKKDKVVIHREVAYINDQCELQEGREFLWDNRYRIFGEYMPEQWHARAVGAEGLLQLDPDIKKRVRFSNAIIMTLPGIWQLEELIAVPHIGFYKTSETPRIRIRFAPSKPLAGVPFSC